MRIVEAHGECVAGEGVQPLDCHWVHQQFLHVHLLHCLAMPHSVKHFSHCLLVNHTHTHAHTEISGAMYEDLHPFIIM